MRFAYLLGVVLLVASSSGMAATIGEDFSQGVSSSLWGQAQQGAFGSPWTIWAPDIEGGLRLAKAADMDVLTQALTLQADVQSTFTIDGNFSVCAAFSLPNLPLSNTAGLNEAMLTLTGSGGFFELLRFADSTTQSVAGASSLGGFGTTADATLSGKFIVTRTGSTMSAFLDRGSGPVLLGSQTSATFSGPMTVELSADQVPAVSPSAARPSTPLDVRFDKVFILADVIKLDPPSAPEPGTPLLLLFGGLALMRRR